MATPINNLIGTTALNKEKSHRRHLLMPLCALIFSAMLMAIGGCSPTEASYGDYVHVPAEGWSAEAPISFAPIYADSTGVYRLSLGVRHDVEYEYSNLSLVVDLVRADKTYVRKVLDFEITDEHGMWKGSGFGALYQHKKVVLSSAPAGEYVDVMVWQGMKGCPSLRHLTEVGLIVEPVKQ